MNNLQEQLKKIFIEDKLDLLIGFEKGTLPMRSAPCFISNVDELSRIIFDFTCQNNLAKMLLNEVKRNPEKKIGIIAKGCDARAIVHLVSEKQIDRGKIVIIAVPCEGVVDPDKLRKILDGREIAEFKVDGDHVELIGNDFNIKAAVDELKSGYCISCEYPNPAEYDYFIGKPIETSKTKRPLTKLEELDKLSSEERWEYFKKEYSKCIRCNACRNACPMCYCTECFVDRNKPAWIGKGNDISDTMIFHIMRVIHLAGRCVSCGACSRACPMGVDIESLNQRVVREVKERFDFTAGLDSEKSPALADYKPDDKDEFIM